jgi:hypothetical protein
MNASTHECAEFGGLPDRRGAMRFPIREDVRYRIVRSKTEIVNGSGTTLNISSGGILFTTAEKLPVGSTVDLSVNWPVWLDDTCPLQLVVTGHVVRAESQQSAVRIDQYEFKTRGLNGLVACFLDLTRGVASFSSSCTADLMKTRSDSQHRVCPVTAKAADLTTAKPSASPWGSNRLASKRPRHARGAKRTGRKSEGSGQVT